MDRPVVRWAWLRARHLKTMGARLCTEPDLGNNNPTIILLSSDRYQHNRQLDAAKYVQGKHSIHRSPDALAPTTATRHRRLLSVDAKWLINGDARLPVLPCRLGLWVCTLSRDGGLRRQSKEDLE